MTQFLHLETRGKDTGCLASLRVCAVFMSSHVKAVVGRGCHFLGMERVQPPSEISALAGLKQHGGTRRSLGGRVASPRGRGGGRPGRCGRLGRGRRHGTRVPQRQSQPCEHQRPWPGKPKLPFGPNMGPDLGSSLNNGKVRAETLHAIQCTQVCSFFLLKVSQGLPNPTQPCFLLQVGPSSMTVSASPRFCLSAELYTRPSVQSLLMSAPKRH